MQRNCNVTELIFRITLKGKFNISFVMKGLRYIKKNVQQWNFILHLGLNTMISKPSKIVHKLKIQFTHGR